LFPPLWDSRSPFFSPHSPRSFLDRAFLAWFLIFCYVHMIQSEPPQRSFFDDKRNQKILKYVGATGLGAVALYFLINVFSGPRYPDELFIDSVATPMATIVRDINIDRPYYNEKVKKKTIRFYRETRTKTKWLEYKGPKRNYKAYATSIKEAAQYGLNPDHYDFKQIDKAVQTLFEKKDRTPQEVATLDVRITASFFLFTTHLIEGRIRTAGYSDYIWKRNIPKENDVELLQQNKSGELTKLISELHPQHPQYEKLRDALQKYRKLENSTRIELTAGVLKGTIKPGKKHPAVPKIRARLVNTDLTPYQPDDSLLYDEKLLKAVKQFQKRHGLIADGIISSATMKYLYQSFKFKADLIELNLERIRWLPREIPEDYVSINIPEYILRVYKNGKEDLQMKVVLGTEFNATPVFTDTMEYIVFNPTWNVPQSIMEGEFIPELQLNPLAFDPERFTIYKNGEIIDPEEEDWNSEDLDPTQYAMVENPGEKNSLGEVKFMMPNDFNIYLHDTPADNLFKKRKRAYSHGCIRLERPVEFAKYLLNFNKDSWNDEKITAAMAESEPKTVNLEKKFPVQIDYRTVWVDDDGLVNFREDLYGHDKRQLALLNKIE
jgi:L,D-transpeptidase YcbB